MPSQINPNQFDDGQPVSKSALRDTLSTVKGELEHGGFTRIAADTPERTVNEKLSEWLSIKDFGAKGDGVTDDSEALVRMRDYTRQDRDKLFTVEFPTGHYVYTNNRWLAHTGRVRVNGNGSTVQCISDNAQWQNRYPFNTQQPDQNPYDAPFNGTSTGYTSGYRFKTVSAGSKTISLVDAGDAASFSAGMRVLLWGYDQQWGGYPANMRYFEWNIIGSVDELTGTITLLQAVKHDYDDRWGDFTTGGIPAQAYYGAPRILSLERPDQYFYAHFIELNDFRIIQNPNENSNAVILACEHLRLNNIRAEGNGNVFPSFNRLAEYRDCSFPRNDMDKVCDLVTWERCYLGMNAVYASGINEVRMVDCEINGAMNLVPRILTVKGCVLRPTGNYAMSTWANSWPSERAIFRDNTIERPGTFLGVVDNHDAISFTADRIDGNGAIRVTNTAAKRNAILRPLIVGAPIIRRDTDEMAHVTAIWYDGVESEHVIEASFSSALTDTTTLNFFSMQYLEAENNTIIGTPVRQIRHIRPLQLGQGVQSYNFSPIKGRVVPNTETHAVDAFVHGLSVRVIKPYIGADAAPWGSVTVVTAAGSTQLIRFSLLTVGRAEIDYAETKATWAGVLDSLNLPNPTELVRRIELRYRQGGNSVSGTPAQMPLIRLGITMESIG